MPTANSYDDAADWVRVNKRALESPPTEASRSQVRRTAHVWAKRGTSQN